MSYLDNLLLKAGCKVVVVLLLQDHFNRCIYRVYTSDGGFVDYAGFDKLPQSLKDWLNDRNSFDYTILGCMVVSGVRVSG